jgi:hypothetical protein
MTSKATQFSSKMAHSRISQDKFLVEYFVEDGLAGVVQFCGHIGALI